MKTYDGLFIFDESLDEDALDAVLAKIGQEIERQGGAVEGRDVMGKRMFSRPIGKREVGLYVWLIFRIEPDKVAALRARFKLNEDIVRVQIENARPREAAPVVKAEAETKEEEATHGES